MLSTEGRGLITVSGAGAAAEVRLSHPLYGEVIRAALPTLRAGRPDWRWSQTVQARPSMEPQDILRLARWLLEARETIPAPRCSRPPRGQPGRRPHLRRASAHERWRGAAAS